VGLTLLTERYAPQIAGVLSCWDRILLFGTLPKVCYAEGMTSYLYERKIRIFDYPKFAEPFRNRLRENAERLAAENGIEIEFLRKRNVRKEDRVKAVLDKRGEHLGLVCILSAMEPCSTYKPLELLSAIEDTRNGRDQLDKLSQPVQNEGRSYPGFNLFDTDDEALFSVGWAYSGTHLEDRVAQIGPSGASLAA
jgi:hypothetical protein